MEVPSLPSILNYRNVEAGLKHKTQGRTPPLRIATAYEPRGEHIRDALHERTPPPHNATAYEPRGKNTRDALELEEGENREWGRLAGWAARVAAEHAILSGRWKCALEERSALILHARSASTRGSAPLTHGPPAIITHTAVHTPHYHA